MRAPKLFHRIKNLPMFPVIPLVPIAIVVSDAVLGVLTLKRLKRLEARVGRPSAAAKNHHPRVSRAHA
jgi:hypothetical protein